MEIQAKTSGGRTIFFTGKRGERAGASGTEGTFRVQARGQFISVSPLLPVDKKRRRRETEKQGNAALFLSLWNRENVADPPARPIFASR